MRVLTVVTILSAAVSVASCTSNAAPIDLGGGRYEFTTWEGKETLYPKLHTFCAAKGARFEEHYYSESRNKYEFDCVKPRPYSGPPTSRIELDIR